MQSGLIVAGIAVGIAVQIFVGSLITSLQANLVQTTVGNAPHVRIKAPTRGDPVVIDERVSRSISERPGGPSTVVEVRDFTALYAEPGSGDSAPLNVKSAELRSLDTIYDISDRLVVGQPRLQADDVLVGRAFADKYGVSPEDEIVIRLSDGRDISVTVAGVFDLGSGALNERQAFAAPGLGRSATGLSTDEYSAVEAQVADPFSSTALARTWRAELPEYDVVDWQAENADLLTALQSQSSSSYLIQGFVLLAVALGIASTLAISAVQKTRQIGILKAMGMGDRAAGAVFVWQAALLGAGGTFAGIALGYLLLWSFSFAPTSFSIDVKPGFVAFSASIGVAVALLSAVIPWRKTTRLDPIEVIQRG